MSEQPARSACDGAVGVSRETAFPELGELLMHAEHDGARQVIRCSEYNAWRLFVMLGLILGANLPAKLLKSVKM